MLSRGRTRLFHGADRCRLDSTRDRVRSIPERDVESPRDALANGLARDHRLTPEDTAWLRASNDRANIAYPDPSSIDADCYDPVANPGARAWFRASATELLELTGTYLELLDRYGVPWVEIRTHTPGRITYEDNVQVVAVPLAHERLTLPADTTHAWS